MHFYAFGYPTDGPVDLIPPVEGLTVVGVTASSVTVRWNVSLQ